MSVTIDGSAGVTTNTGAVYNSIQSKTAVASTSGTSIDFTSIPSWVKRITVMLSGVSTSGTSDLQIQIGSGSVTTSGYVGNTAYGLTTFTSGSVTTGLVIASALVLAANTHQGIAVLTLVNSANNTWVGSSSASSNTGYAFSANTTKALSGTLDRVRITTVNGTDTFDAGSINILYE